MSESEMEELDKFVKGFAYAKPSKFISRLTFLLRGMKNPDKENGCIAQEFYQVLTFCEDYVRDNVKCDCDICIQFGD